MIFEQIKIHNLFSYYGEQVFNFPAPTPQKPIVLIAGRNGFGKTSFINCVKLLFLGTSDVMLNDAQVGRTLRPNTYLLGIDRIWQGAFNRDAREENIREYGITLIWREERGRVITRRYWKLDNGEPEQYLRIETDFEEFGLGRNHVIDDLAEAEEFLQRRLPRDIVPLFFYDGEKIQSIAESNQDGLMRQIEKLLGLAAVDTLDEYLDRSIKNWKRDGTAANEQAELDTLRANFQLKQAEKAKAKAAFDEGQADLENLEREVRRLKRQMEDIRAQVLQRDTPHLKEKLLSAANNYENICQKISSNLPLSAPLWANPELVKKIAAQLEDATGNPSSRLAEEIRDVFDRLPSRLFDEPPHPSPSLSETQKAHYRRKLGAILFQYTETPSGGFFSLNPAETSAIKRRIDYFVQADSERQRFAGDLRDASRARRNWQQTKADYEAIDELSPLQKQAFKEREAALIQFDGQRSALLAQSGKCEGEIARLDTDLARLSAEISQQETKLIKAGINSQHIERAQQARRVFETYRLRLKQSRRQKIETTLNDCFKRLMTSHRLIENIKLSDDFALSYHDAQDREIGISNVSAGMKQLAAQALLWALSEVSGRGIPVIVDTPLARIDRQHQENLLQNYYPNAADQVIVLPTDSELDIQKYELLKPRICGEYRLENPEGDRTRVISNVSMYSVEEV